MKKLASILTASILTLVSVTANAHSEHCKNTELGSVMEDMKSELKAYVDAFKGDDQVAMQQHAAQLISNAKEAKQLIPLKLQDSEHHMAEHDDHMVEMAKVDHSGMSHSTMDHSAMESMDHSNMPDMEDMDHNTHMAHMSYIKGIDELLVLFGQLQQVDDKKLVKNTLIKVKKHSKRSHKQFRMSCDK
ncbi:MULTISPECIES: copper resistance protein CopA [unclassified Agarivorans]|uniref:copper resistance protein CopA n=1 Tax=unclassified Agarivorans TaxID=2636026 RepID=UPI003D7E413D